MGPKPRWRSFSQAISMLGSAIAMPMSAVGNPSPLVDELAEDAGHHRADAAQRHADRGHAHDDAAAGMRHVRSGRWLSKQQRPCRMLFSWRSTRRFGGSALWGRHL